jgi:hypothetical protein
MAEKALTLATGAGNRKDTEFQKEKSPTTWLHRRYDGLARASAPRPLPDVSSPEESPFERTLLVERDELRSLHQSGRLLHGFVEGPIYFPPTYRRTRDTRGDAEDYTDIQRLKVYS